jgi:poly-gamma-glutamate synthesis protein (capsule biosynthesis protein)
MSPANVPCLAVARPDACVLANNHVLDFGHQGLEETLDVLAAAGLRAVGAGRDVHEARRPAAVDLDGGGRVVVFSFGMTSSGIPTRWSATEDRTGVDLVPELSDASAAEFAARVQRVKRPGDVVVASIHWESNWGYDVSRDQVRFAHRLVDGGVDVVHGHSSHHPRPIEVYRDRLILYGCGDLIDDYEGITGYEEYRSDLRLLYLASVEPGTGKLAGLQIAPMQAWRMRLRRASRADRSWLRAVLGEVSRGFGSGIVAAPDGMLALRVRDGGTFGVDIDRGG